MKEKIKRILNLQKSAFIVVWAAPILLAALYECGAETFQKGIYEGNAQMEYIFQSVSILLTIGLIPFALRMFNLNLVKRIKELPMEQALKSYQKWSDVRLGLLFVPAILGVSFYYLTMNTTNLFCACMALIATLFCIPSENRIKNELDLPENITE
ncbi:MAG: hypothetical protein IKU64_01530 [Bacteroides sp.]|nr:hypothetical protein [Bacteroides sp.]